MRPTVDERLAAGKQRYNGSVIRRALFPSIVVVLLAGSIAAASQRPVVPPSGAELHRDVSALAAPEMEGRASGTAGGDLAARYLADRLAAMGLKPGGEAGSFFQSFIVASGVAVAPESLLERLGAERRPLELGRDWTPHGGSLAADIRGEIVFVGHGVVAADRGWDDYAGVDVQDKIALALEGSPSHLTDLRSSRLDKLVAARRHGARALLIVSDALPSIRATAAAVRLVSGTISLVAADRLLKPLGRTIAQLRAALAGSRAPSGFGTGVEARMRVSLAREDRRAANVIGILPGTDPERASEVVVLGAHYDHLGRVDGAVHPGADDNASGTAVVLGLARSFSMSGGTPRTLVFALFGGEEAGLLGSTHYVRRPTLPMERTIAMLNFDMVGRMRDRRLNVGYVGSGSGFRDVVTAAAADSLNLVLHDALLVPSDHMSFYGAGTPVLYFLTDPHDDHHTPRDTADKINVAGMTEVAGFAARVVAGLGGEMRPTYVKLSPPASTSQGGGASGSAFLGVSVDAHLEADGLRLASVLPDTAAARAGLKSGDVIVRLGDQPINRFEDLTKMLERKQPGDTLLVLYLRDGEDHVASATLGARP